MKTHIKVISDGADYEVYYSASLIGTCGSLMAAARLQKFILGADAAFAYLLRLPHPGEAGLEAIELLGFALNKGVKKRGRYVRKKV